MQSMEEKDLEWLSEQELQFDLDELGEFESVWHSTGGEFSAEDLKKVFHEETSAFLLVDGDLIVTGPLGIDEQHGLQVSGNLECEQLLLTNGLFFAGDVAVRDFTELMVGADEVLETYDAQSLTTQVFIVAGGETPPNVDAAHVFDSFEVEELAKVCETNFGAVQTRLEAGGSVDPDWIESILD